MNLVQIQERLKDLPMQAVMAYANGQNPQVPPYLALGELNRRKQMEQQAAQPPRGTVKDSIEQQVGLMQLQKLRQGQMAQQMGQQGMQAPTIPQGTPEPQEQPEAEMAMAAGGVTSLPMREMNFGSGGIIAFADEGLVDEAKAAARAAKEKLYGYGLRQRQQDPEGYAAAQAEAAIAEENLNKAQRSNPDLGPVGAMGKNIIPTAATPRIYSQSPGNTYKLPEGSPESRVENTYTDKNGIRQARPPGVSDDAWRQHVAQNSRPEQTIISQGPTDRVVPRYPAATPPVAPVPPVGIATVAPAQPRPPAPPAPPAVPAQSDAEKYLAGILAGAKNPDLPAPFEMPKQAPIGEDYLKYVADREAKRKADEEKFKQREAGRSQRDFFNSLIAAGEATRGQKGIGSLFGGFGKAYSQAATEAEDRQTAFENAMQEKADLDAKMKFEIANLRRAEERGDAKGAYDSKLEIAKIQQQQQANAITAAGHIASNASAERIARANNLTQLEVARIHQATAGQPDATERMIAKYGEIKRTKGDAAAEEYLKTIERVKTGTKAQTAQERLDIQRQALASKYPAYMSAMNTYATSKDPQKRADALAQMRRVEEAEGIKSAQTSSVDTSQWGDPRVSSK